MSAPVVGRLAARVGLPRPPALVRGAEGTAVCEARALVGAAPEGQLEAPLTAVLGEVGVPSGVLTAGARFGALLFDATGIADSTQLVELHRFFHPALAALARNGRVILLGRPPELASSLRAHTAQRALDGLHARARQGARPTREHRAAPARRARCRAGDGLDASLPALTCQRLPLRAGDPPLGSRRRPRAFRLRRRHRSRGARRS